MDKHDKKALLATIIDQENKRLQLLRHNESYWNSKENEDDERETLRLLELTFGHPIHESESWQNYTIKATQEEICIFTIEKCRAAIRAL
jgi:hypothetical protein